jgi:hypothetical protein
VYVRYYYFIYDITDFKDPFSSYDMLVFMEANDIPALPLVSISAGGLIQSTLTKYQILDIQILPRHSSKSGTRG